MVSIRLAAAAVAIGSLVGSASAQQSQGFYVGGGAGATISGLTKGALAPNSDSTLSSPRHDLERKWEIGTIGVLSLGYRVLGNCLPSLGARQREHDWLWGHGQHSL